MFAFLPVFRVLLVQRVQNTDKLFCGKPRFTRGHTRKNGGCKTVFPCFGLALTSIVALFQGGKILFPRGHTRKNSGLKPLFSCFGLALPSVIVLFRGVKMRFTRGQTRKNSGCERTFFVCWTRSTCGFNTFVCGKIKFKKKSSKYFLLK